MPTQSQPAPQRNALLRAMRNFYALYLGVTPPSPENEKKIATIVISGTIILIIALVFFVRFLLEMLFSR